MGDKASGLLLLMGCPLTHHHCVEVCRAQSLSYLLKINCSAKQLEIQKYDLSTWLLFSPFAPEEESISLVIRDGNSVSEEELGSLEIKPGLREVLESSSSDLSLLELRLLH